MTTNIKDLPGGNSNQPSIQLHTKEKQQNKPSLNSINEMVSGLQKAANNNMTRLPERDIPQNPERITHDPEIQPNFVPPPPPNPHYIEDEMDYEYMMRRNSNDNKKKNKCKLYMMNFKNHSLVLFFTSSSLCHLLIKIYLNLFQHFLKMMVILNLQVTYLKQSYSE